MSHSSSYLTILTSTLSLGGCPLPTGACAASVTAKPASTHQRILRMTFLLRRACPPALSYHRNRAAPKRPRGFGVPSRPRRITIHAPRRRAVSSSDPAAWHQEGRTMRRLNWVCGLLGAAASFACGWYVASAPPAAAQPEQPA